MIATVLRKAPNPDLPFLLSQSTYDTPRAFGSLQALARAVQRRRGDAPIEVREEEIQCSGDQFARKVAAIHELNDGQQPVRFIGYAWLNGRGRDAMIAALRRAEPHREPAR